MALDQPFSPGPNALSSPIPGDPGGQASPPVAAAPPDAGRAPASAPMPQASSPDRAPAKSDNPADEFNSVSPADLSEMNAGPPGQNPADEFSGKNVEGTFLGMKARVTDSGVPQIYVPRTKSWHDVNDNDGGIWKQMAKGIYSAVESLPETAAAMGSSLIPGGGVGGTIARSAIAGGAAAIGRSTGLSEHLVNMAYNPKDFFILKKIAGVQGQPGAVSAGLTTAIGQSAAEALGGINSSGAAKAAGKAQTDQSVLSILQQGKPLEQAAMDAGIPVRGTQIASQLPGGGDAAALEKGMAGGQYGAVNQSQIQLANQQQAQSIGESIDRLVNKVAPNVDFDNMDIAKITGEGGQRINFADRVENNMHQNLSANRSAVSALAKDRQFDPSPIVNSFESSIKSLLPINKGIVKPDGSVSMQAFMDTAKQQGYSDQSLSKFASSYFDLKNAISRDAPGLSTPMGGQDPGSFQPATGSQMYNPSVPQDPTASALIPHGEAGDAQAGITFKQLTAFTDRIQDLAFSNGKDTQFTRALGNAATAAKGLEDDVTAQMFKENGQASMAQRVINQKESYSSLVGDLRQVSNLVSQNPDNAARIVFNAPLSTVKRVLPALSDQQRQEIAGSLLMNSAYEDISKVPATNMISSVNADSIRSQFFGTQEARAKSELIFGDAAPDLENILHTARMIQGPAGASEKASTNGALSILRVIPRMMTKGVPLDKLGVVLNSVFSDNPTAKEIINTSLSDMIVKQEQALGKSMRSAKTAAATARFFNSAPVRAGAAGVANFGRNEVAN